MSRLTAADAAKIADEKDPSIAIEFILQGIRNVAEKGERKYVTRAFGFGNGSCYTVLENYPPLCKAILKELCELGYQASVRSASHQFVDIWLEVSWDGVKGGAE